CEQPGILKYRFAYGDAILTELASFSHQPGSMSKGPHWNWSIIGRHAAELVAGNQRCACAQVCGAGRGEHASRSGANNDDVDHLRSSSHRSGLDARTECSIKTRRQNEIPRHCKTRRGAIGCIKSQHSAARQPELSCPDSWCLAARVSKHPSGITKELRRRCKATY